MRKPARYSVKDKRRLIASAVLDEARAEAETLAEMARLIELLFFSRIGDEKANEPEVGIVADDLSQPATKGGSKRGVISINAVCARTGLSRDTIRQALIFMGSFSLVNDTGLLGDHRFRLIRSALDQLQSFADTGELPS